MKIIFSNILLLFTFLMISLGLSASKSETTSGGDFDDASNWDCGSCYTTADTLVVYHDMSIPNNNIVTIQASVLIIKSNQDLEFSANSQLILPTEGAIITMEDGASLYAANNSNGTLIEINGVGVWGNGCSGCNNGTIPGPEIISEFSSPGNPALLPIELLSFEARAADGATILTWTTTEEINNDYFTIYRSKDGQQWNAIATIDGAGTTAEDQTYRYHDSEFQSGTYYYQLKQTDWDGQFSYTDVVSVSLGSSSFTFSPNPADDYITIHAEADVYSLSLVDYTGKVIRSVRGHEGSVLDIADVPAGVYLLIYQNASGKVTTKKLTVQ